MSNVGIPMWVFQLQPRNSEAREPTSMVVSIERKCDKRVQSCISSSSTRVRML